MATFLLGPDDTLILADSEHKMGNKVAHYSFTYDDVLVALRGEKEGVRRPSNAGVRFSRLVSLTVNAIRKGKWATGAEIDRDEIFAKMVARFNELHVSDHANITANAKKTLADLSNTRLSTLQKKNLDSILAAIDFSDY